MALVIPDKFSSLLHGITDEVSSAVGAASNKRGGSGYLNKIL